MCSSDLAYAKMRSTHNSNEFSCSLSCPCSQTKQNLKPKAMFSRLPRVFIASATSYVLVCKEYPNRSACQSSNSNPMDCPVPACADKADMFRKSIQGISGKKSSHEQNHTVDEFGILPKRYSGCPLDRSELGRSSWDLLHTMAANYPEKPTKEQQTKMKNLIESLSEFYPCIHCAIEFQKSIKASPPRYHEHFYRHKMYTSNATKFTNHISPIVIVSVVL